MESQPYQIAAGITVKNCYAIMWWQEIVNVGFV